MTKTGWAVVAVTLLVLGGIGFALYVGMKLPVAQVAAPVIESPVEAAVPAPIEEAAPKTETVVTYSDSGFSPKSVSVAEGSTVRFVNNSTHTMWVGVGEHPSHTEYDGTSTKEHCTDGKNTNGSFDQCVASSAGTSFSYTFEKTGSFEYHNHTRSADSGVVVVK